MDIFEKHKLIDEIIEPFSVVDGSLYYDPHINIHFMEKCTELRVEVHDYEVIIHYKTDKDDYFHKHDVLFSSLGYDRCPDCWQFCLDINYRMHDKFEGFYPYYTLPKRVNEHTNWYEFQVEIPKPELKKW